MSFNSPTFIFALGFQFVFSSGLLGEDISPNSLFRLLTEPGTNRQGVEVIKAGGTKYIPLLLKWTVDPPKTDAALWGIHRRALADIFGELKLKEAVPFLLKNIDMDRDTIRAVTINSDLRYQADLNNKPAMAALIKIGEVNPLINAHHGSGFTDHEKDELLIVICEIANRESETYLLVLKENLENSLKRIDMSLKKIHSSKQQ